jgi:hypothetical protein
VLVPAARRRLAGSAAAATSGESPGSTSPPGRNSSVCTARPPAPVTGVRPARDAHRTFAAIRLRGAGLAGYDTTAEQK